MDVNGVGAAYGASPPRSTTPASETRPAAAASKPESPRDELEISSAGKMLDQLSNSPEVRQERIARIREAIANGTYDTDEKLEAALERMFQDMGRELDTER